MSKTPTISEVPAQTKQASTVAATRAAAAPKPTSFVRRILGFWPVIAGIGAGIVAFAGGMVAIANFIGDIRVLRGNVTRHQADIERLNEEHSRNKLDNTHRAHDVGLSLIVVSQQLVRTEASIGALESRYNNQDTRLRAVISDVQQVTGKATTFDSFLRSQTNWPALIVEVRSELQDLHQRLAHFSDDLQKSEKRLAAGETRASEVSETLRKMSETISGLQTLNDKVPIMESILKGLPKDQNAAVKALGQVGIVREALIAYVEIETTKLVNSMLLSDPSEGALARLHDLEQLTDACLPMLRATTDGEMSAPVFEVVRNIRDVVDRSRLEQPAGSEAMARLRRVSFRHSPRAYALAQILLARCDSFPSRREAKKHSERAKRAVAYAESALSVYKSSSSALNLKLINELNVLFNELDEGRRLEFLQHFPVLWRGFAKVQEYDESLVGRFRYLNNSAYYMSLALLYLSDPDDSRRLELGAFEQKMEEPIQKVCADILRFCDMALQISVHQSGAWDTKAEALTSVAEIIGATNITETMRMEIARAVGAGGTLADAKSQLIKEAVAAFQMSLTGRSGHQQLAQAEQKLSEDDFFIRWPQTLRQEILEDLRAQRLSKVSK